LGLAVLGWALAVAAGLLIVALWLRDFQGALTVSSAPESVRATRVKVLEAVALVRRGLSTPVPIGGTGSTTPGRIAMAFGMILAGFWAARWARQTVVRRLVERVSVARGAAHVVATIISYTMVGVVVMIALGIAGFRLSTFAIFAGALGFGVGFGMQNIVANFISGIVILFERPIKVGDYVTIGDLRGTVKRIGARSATIETKDRVSVIVPNSEFIESNVINWTHSDPVIRVKIPVGVAYGSDVPLVKGVLLGVGENHPDREPSFPVAVGFAGFGSSSLDFVLLFHIRSAIDRGRIVSECNYAIEEAFRGHGIEIPFPQQDLYVKSVTPDFVEKIAAKPASRVGDDEDRDGGS
jgi:small-conductance mechanosensitive channel